MGTGRWMVLLGEDDTMDQMNGFSSLPRSGNRSTRRRVARSTSESSESTSPAVRFRRARGSLRSWRMDVLDILRSAVTVSKRETARSLPIAIEDPRGAPLLTGEDANLLM